MKKTKKISIFPMSFGLDKSSIPGTQNPASLTIAKNIVIGSRPSLRKRPGIIKIPYVGNNDGVQNAIQFYGTVGGAKVSELVRMRNGRFEALRDVDGSGYQFVDVLVDNEDGTFSDVNAHPTDKVVFEQFANVLIISIENRAPLKYNLGGYLTALAVRTTHLTDPPTFFRKHDFRLFYGGIGSDRDRLFASAVNDIESYSLLTGGFASRFNDGDGDPVGLTGMSETFRGDVYVYKWNQIYRMYRAGYGYGIDQITDEAGAVSHTCIVSTQNDVYSVDSSGIRSLSVTDKYGAAEEATLTYPIYEYFQENVNWSAYKNFHLTYDKQTATLLFAYTSVNSSTNDRILGMNLRKKEFFEWEDCRYSAIGKYSYNGQQRLFVHCEENGAGILEQKHNLLFEDKISIDIKTGILFPLGNPSAEFTLTQGWLLARPTTKSTKVDIEYSINSKKPVSVQVDTYGDGYGSIINDIEPGGYIGTDLIGRMPQDMGCFPFKLQGDGNSVEFRIQQTPPDNDKDQVCEIYGIIYEIEYNEDTTDNVSV